MPASRKEDRIDVRVDAEFKERIQEAASLRGQSLSEFAISCLAERAEKVLREQAILELSRRDRERFVEVLTNPPSPTDALLEATRLYNKAVVEGKLVSRDD